MTSLPPRFLKNIAPDLRFENVDELNYVGAVALAAAPIADARTDAYVRYFKAEQEQDVATKELIYSRCENPEVVSLLRGRRLLERPRVTTAEVADWLADSGGGGYAHFLAGVGGLQANDPAYASVQMRISALAFERAGKPSRELQSLLQDPALSAADIRYLRAHAREVRDLKSFHIAGLSLATHARRLGDVESARRYAGDAAVVFRESFLDPRRERIALALLRDCDPVDHRFTALETRLLKRLQRGACAKSELLAEIYGRSARYADARSLDMRFRALLSRLNRKIQGAIVRQGEGYRLRRD